MGNKSSLVTFNGYKFRLGVPKYTGDHRWRQVVSFLYYNGKLIKTLYAYGHNLEMLDAKTQQVASQLILNYSDSCFQHLRDTPSVSIRLDDYVEARWNHISGLKRWAGKKQHYSLVWENTLSPIFGHFNLRTCTSFPEFDRAMEDLTRHKRQKRSWTDAECEYWRILHDILDFAVDDEVLDSNPLIDINRKCHQSASTNASKLMARCNLDYDEQQMVLAKDGSSEDNAVPVAMRLQMLTGLTAFELCALNTDDLVSGDYVSWLEISKVYKQRRRQEPIMTTLLSEANAYRKVVCTDVVLDLLRQQISNQKRLNALGQISSESGHENTKLVIPLFTDECGFRLTPEAYKREVKQVLTHIVKDGARLPFRRRGKTLMVTATMASKDLLRGTTEHMLRNRCGMAPGEIEAFLGRDRVNTISVFYIDWGNELKLLYMKHQLERWHSQLTGKYGYQNLLSCSVVCHQDTTLTLTAEHGYRGQITTR